jgi:hypothetical protein
MGEAAMKKWISALAVAAGLLGAGSAHAAFPPFQSGAVTYADGVTCGYEVITINETHQQSITMWCDDGNQYFRSYTYK